MSADDLPPRKQVTGEGITVTEFVDGRVRVKGQTLWNEAFDTTYDDCTYFRNAVPVLQRTFSPERAKSFEAMCPPPPPVAIDKGKGKKIAKATKATKATKVAEPAKPTATAAGAPAK